VPQAKAPSAGATAIWQFPSPLKNKPPEFDLTLFDGLLTCIDQQFDIDNARVSTMGFSAGAIWITYLLMHRSDYLASAAIFSGGISPSLFPYNKPTYKVPVIGSHGGPSDVFQGFIKFADMMNTLSAKLVKDAHVMILCAHGQGHTVTPKIVTGAVEFVFSHKYGDGSSIYDAARVAKVLPSYCSLQ
jgi:dienelactone hydrolase